MRSLTSNTPTRKRDGAFGIHETSTISNGDRAVVARMVQQVRVEVFFNDVEVEPSLPHQGALCAEGRRLAGEFVTAVVGYIRVNLNHDWLGTSTDEPELVNGRTTLFDADSGERFSVSQGEFPGCVHSIEHADLTAELLDDILTDIAAEESLSLSKMLIFDASGTWRGFTDRPMCGLRFSFRPLQSKWRSSRA